MSVSHLLVINSILYSVLLGIVIVFYTYIYPKKKISLLILLVLIALLPLLSIIRSGTYESGDLSTHIMESIYFFKVLAQGNLFPIWGGEMNATYGYPAFLFTYPLPFYVTTVFHLMGFSFINSVKLLLAAAYLSSGLFMFLWLKKEVKEKAAFVGALFYLFAPYHLVDLHFRADVGEILAFVFLPLSLLAAKNLFQSGSIRWFLLEVLALSALILSHPAISMAGFPVILVYILVLIGNQPKKRKIMLFVQALGFLSALLLTSFYLVPVLGELRFTLNHHIPGSISFTPFTELLYAPWRYGFLFQGPKGQLSFLLGYPSLLVIFLAVVFLIKKKILQSEKALFLASLGVVSVSIFLMLNVSKPLWDFIPLLKSFQFSYRLLGITMFAGSVLAALVVNKMKKKALIFCLCLFVIFSTILNWGNRKNIPEVTDTILENKIPFTATNGAGLGQAVPMWADPKNTWARVIPTNHLEVIQGKGSVKELERENIYHLYQVDARTELHLRENTQYFPGWNVFVDQKLQQIHILNSSSPKGLISFVVSKGNHKISIVFQDTFMVQVGKMISIGTLFLLFIGIITIQVVKIRK